MQFQVPWLRCKFITHIFIILGKYFWPEWLPRNSHWLHYSFQPLFIIYPHMENETNVMDGPYKMLLTHYSLLKTNMASESPMSDIMLRHNVIIEYWDSLVIFFCRTVKLQYWHFPYYGYKGDLFSCRIFCITAFHNTGVVTQIECCNLFGASIILEHLLCFIFYRKPALTRSSHGYLL